ncbi:hypothetical protein M758_3G101300 [Ceratodon purpureus]|nr:hypothetical protein M758_3G101300 [Ceratodon purpureus]
MGAQRSNEEEDLDELDIVVDISRDSRMVRGAPARGAEKVAPMDESDSEPSQRRSSSSGTADSSVGTQGMGEDGKSDREDEEMEEEIDQETVPESPVKAAVVAKVARKLKPHQVEAVDEADEVEEGSPTKNGREGPVSSNMPQDSDSPVKQKSRKRKKTIHYRNSRVPHAVPTKESESDDESDGPEGNEEAEELPARPAPGPRSAASKLKSMLPIGDKLLKPPRNAKELMATGLLEGHYVRCSCRGEQLTGILQDMGVICNCRICKGTQTVSISAFEAHSGSTSHHPSDNIYLENGKNLRDILSAGQESADCGDNILRALKHAIGEIQGIPKKEISCGKCGKDDKGSFVSCKGPKCSSTYHAECVGLSSPHRGDWFCGKCEKSQARKSLTVLKPKRLATGADREDARLKEKELTMMARSARDAHLHKALFLPGGLPDGTELGYYARNQCVLKGVKQGGGICCSCCDQEISASAFEQHAGCEARRNPYGSILLKDGRSLKDMCKELADQSKLGDRSNQVGRTGDSNSCSGCGEQGDLATCQGCESLWCNNCAKQSSGHGPEKDSSNPWCKICKNEISSATKASHRVSSKFVDVGANIPASDDGGRNVRHFQAPDTSGGCAICKKWTLKKFGFDMTMLVCDQCGQEYHVGCLREAGMDEELPEAEWFCHPDCQHIVRILSQLVDNGPESLSDSIVSELLESRQHQQGALDMAESSSPVFGWQILHGSGDNVVNGRTLGQAVDIFTGCSDPIRDASSGRDMIPFMVHSRTFKDYDFNGIYCVVLKLNEKVVSTALVQIFGREVAEVPLVATSLDHQGQGLCKALMTTIERLLGVLNVERLILPAAKNAETVWVNKYGFSRMDDAQLKELRSKMRLMTFTGTNMLVKPITMVKLDKPISLPELKKSNDHWAAERR